MKLKVSLPARKPRLTLSREVFAYAALELDDLIEGAVKLLPDYESHTLLPVPPDDTRILLRVKTTERGSRTLCLRVSEIF